MSQTIVAVFIQMLTIFLPMLGITVGGAQLTSAVQTIIIVVSGIWIYIRRLQKGDVSLGGVRK